MFITAINHNVTVSYVIDSLIFLFFFFGWETRNSLKKKVVVEVTEVSVV